MKDRALVNAKAKATIISDLANMLNPEWWARLEELREHRSPTKASQLARKISKLEQYGISDLADVQPRAAEEAVEVGLRSGWASNWEDVEPGEFYILLSCPRC